MQFRRSGKLRKKKASPANPLKTGAKLYKNQTFIKKLFQRLKLVRMYNGKFQSPKCMDACPPTPPTALNPQRTIVSNYVESLRFLHVSRFACIIARVYHGVDIIDPRWRAAFLIFRFVWKKREAASTTTRRWMFGGERTFCRRIRKWKRSRKYYKPRNSDGGV